MKTVLFICTGNTCRSPMAEAIARHVVSNGLLGEDLDVFVASAGVYAGNGLPVSPETIDALEALNIDHEGASKSITPEMAKKADVIFCMTASHQAAVQQLLDADPNHADEHDVKVVLLDPAGDLDDPIGRGPNAYRQLAARMVDLIPARLKEMLDHEDRSRIGSSR